MPPEGTPSSILSLPQGGGALHGIGEKFSPDLFTGTGNFTVPIALPPGRNGFQPELNLVYSSGNGNGPFGVGWSLSIPGVSRKTVDGVPRYNEAKKKLRAGERRDVFILSGTEDLVPVKDSDPVPVEYRPRTEGLFARIVRKANDDHDYWVVQSKDGLTSTYGNREAGAGDPAVIKKPGTKDVFAWKLTQTSDPFGNLIRYEYEPDRGEKDGHRWDQPLLKCVRYVDYGEEPDTRFLVKVEFEYDAVERKDPFSDYRAGFEIRTTKLCKSIRVSTHTAAGETPNVRAYSFLYERDPHNGVSLLRRMDIIGYDDEGMPYDDDDPASVYKKQLPPLSFDYTRFAPEKRQFELVSGQDLPARAVGSPDMELVDLYGAGLPDLLEMNAVVRYWRNVGNGRFDLPRPMRDAPPHSLADPGVQMIDANGDGRTDLLVTQGTLSGYYSLQFGGLWQQQFFHKYQVAPSFDLKDPEVRLLDLTGDGVTDVLRSGTRLECFFNDPHEGWLADNTRWVERQALEIFPNVNFSDSRVKLADMTGDGLQDIVLVHDDNVEYWPNLGHGNWGRRLSMGRGPRFPHGYDPQHILVGDVDGDGLADLVYVDHDKVMLWLNQSGNGWSTEPIVIKGTPPSTSMDHLRLVDLHGTGVSGVLWSTDSTGLSRQHLMFLDFTGGVKPYVLNEMDNHMGAVTHVEYRSSTHYYLEDQKKPNTRWRTPLPFPVQVVAKVEAIDQISQGKLTTEYRYHHGYWDGAEREFRGFGMVEQLDSETFEEYHAAGLHGNVDDFKDIPRKFFSKPTLTKTWFHQGPVGEEFGDWAETDYTGEYWQGDPQLLGHTEQVNSFLDRFNDRPGSMPSPRNRRVKRDALRTLRGSMLRSELYAVDGDDRVIDGEEIRKRPYTVTEHAYNLKEIDPPSVDSDRPWIFLPHSVAQRTSEWERGDDPMTQFSFTDYRDEENKFDRFGRPHRQTTVAMPRLLKHQAEITGAVVGPINPNEKRVLATHTRTFYTEPTMNPYINDRVAQVKTYELANPPPGPDDRLDSVSAALRKQVDFAQLQRDRFDGLAVNEVILIGHQLNHYDGPDFEGLPVGQLDKHGAVKRSETLVFTEKLLNDSYDDRRPAYLDGAATLPDNRPPTSSVEVGYRKEIAVAGSYEAGYYADTKRLGLSARGLVIGTEDALRHQTRIDYDDNHLLAVKVIDAAKMENSAKYNYRLLRLQSLTEPNGNSTHVIYNPIGLPLMQFVVGRDTQGGNEDKPEISFAYEFLNFDRQRARDAAMLHPISVHTTRRIHHLSDSVSDDSVETREYSDGFGRLIQTQTQAEEWACGANGDDVALPAQAGVDPGTAVAQRVRDRVVVSGWQVFDNKGKVVEKYEPFFAHGWNFLPESAAKNGKHASLFYDPRGHVIRTVNPDGSEQRVIFGAPISGTRLEIARTDTAVLPAGFRPTPWESYTYDANDLAGITRATDNTPLTDRAPVAHHVTPSSVVLDGLGRARCAVSRNGADPDDWFLTCSDFDIRGNLQAVKDPLGREAFRHHYDLLNRALTVKNIDAGRRTSVFDAQGNLVEYRNSNGSLFVRTYDDLNRPRELWARNGDTEPFTRRERIKYGDDGGEVAWALARPHNTLGKPVEHYDEAGLLEMPEYDFKGNLREKRRRTIRDDLLPDWQADWPDTDPESQLETTVHQTSTRYDALNRPIELTYPQGVDGVRKKLTPRYNRAGALEGVQLDNDTYVEHIAYNAKGQRVLIAYSNGVMTRYAYDPQTFRLARLHTARLSQPGLLRRLVDFVTRDKPAALTFETSGDPIQDFTYTYDLVGNIIRIEERTPHCGFSANSDRLAAGDTEFTTLLSDGDALIRRFEYDPTYRLAYATGRACKGDNSKRGLEDDPRCGFYAPGDPTRTQDNAHLLTEGYTEQYTYDPAGNMRQLSHQPASATKWDRVFGMGDLPNEEWKDAPNNRLTSLANGAGTIPNVYTFDNNGNLIGQNTERHHTWDHGDRMIGFRVQPRDAPAASVTARYLYGADGMRVKKWVRNQQRQVNTTVYVDGFFEHHSQITTTATVENNSLHVMANQSRIALVRVGDPLDARDASPQVQYIFGDHLGSCNVVLGGSDSTASTFINREEYFPYGETSFGSFGKKRYRYSGKERDEESGWYYFGYRYFSAPHCRWTSCDRVRSNSESPLYIYAASSPIRFIDKLGLSTTPASTGVEPRKLKGIDKKIADLDEAKAKIRVQIEAKQLEIKELAQNNVDIQKQWIDELGPDEQKKIEGLQGVIDKQATQIVELEGQIAEHNDELRELGKQTNALIEKRAKKFPKDPPSGGTPPAKKSLWARGKEAVKDAIDRVKPGADKAKRVVAEVVAKVPAPVQKLAVGAMKVGPAIGPIIGTASAVSHAYERDYVAATFDVIGIIPGEGDAFDAGRTVGELIDQHFHVGEAPLTGWGEMAGDLHDKYWELTYGNK